MMDFDLFAEIVLGPGFIFGIVMILLIPAGCYFFGVYLRWKIFDDSSVPLKNQMLLGIVGCIGVVGPMSAVLFATLQGIKDENAVVNSAAYLVILGVIIENGMVMQEFVFKRFTDRQSDTGLNA